MRVLVDTSAWVDFFNGFPSEVTFSLRTLIAGEHEICTCGIILAEVLQGLRNDRGRQEILGAFEAMTFLETMGKSTYLRAAEIYRSLRVRGRTIRSTIDCIIAAFAEEYGCAILAKDRDLTTIVQSGVVRVQLFER